MATSIYNAEPGGNTSGGGGSDTGGEDGSAAMAPVAASVPRAALLAPRLQRRLRLLAPRPAEDLDRRSELLDRRKKVVRK